jgi:hypothetical protein
MTMQKPVLGTINMLANEVGSCVKMKYTIIKPGWLLQVIHFTQTLCGSRIIFFLHLLICQCTISRIDGTISVCLDHLHPHSF